MRNQKVWNFLILVGCLFAFNRQASGFAPSGPGNALDFNGTNGYVSFAPDVWFHGDFTIEAWVYVRSYNNWSRLIDFGDGPDNNIVYLALTAGTGGLPTVGVFTNNNNTPVFSTGSTLPLNQWVHLALTASGTSGTIYINGVAQGSGTLNVAPAVIRTNNYLGRSNYGADAYANAIFDEVRIWNVARTAAQIKSTMNYSLPPTSTNLVANWKFNENGGSQAYDSSGNSHTGVLSNGVNWVSSGATIVSGFGNAVNFNGSQYVNVPHQSTLDAYPLTIMTWFKTAQGGTAALVNKYVSSSYNGFQLFLGGGQLRGWFIRDTTNSIFASAAGAPAANDSQWHHAAFTVDATGGRLYLDGVLLTNTPWVGTAGPVTTTQPLSFALYPGDSLMAGQMDEVSVWNTALSPEQIRLYATGGLIGTESNLVAYYRLDEGSGTSAADASGQGHTGTLMSGATWVVGAPQPFFDVRTIGSSFITPSNAILSGAVNPMGLDTKTWFEYGTTTNYGSNSYILSYNDGSFQLKGLAVTLDGLDPLTFYHYRLVATNSLGTNYGQDLAFLSGGGLIVTNPADNGPATLRQCIADAGNGAIIGFSFDGTVLLTNQLTITNQITIRGHGISATTVSGSLLARVFNITSGAGVTLQNLTIQDARVGGNGAGIYNLGSLTLSNCVVTNNVLNAGANGSPSINGTQGGVGGGIYNNGNLYLLNSTFSHNVAGNGGSGGDAGTGSSHAGNGAAGGSGGAIYNDAGGTAVAYGCTFTGNAGGNGGNGGLGAAGLVGSGGVGGGGGAISCLGNFTMTLCTIDGNTVGGGGNNPQFTPPFGFPSASGNGGGILNGGSSFSLTASTISRNSSSTGIGGIWNFGVMSVRSTLVAANTGSSPDLSGNFNSLGHNLIGNNLNASGFTNGINADIVGSNTNVINARLNSLADNGGQTFSASPQPASPALENGDDSLVQSPFNLVLDQRGKPRLSGGHVDIGAVEAVAGLSTWLLNPSMTTNGNFGFSFSNTPRASFTVFTSTNPALPWSNWNVLTGAVEVSPGYFQFISAPQTNNSMRFFNVRSP